MITRRQARLLGLEADGGGGGGVGAGNGSASEANLLASGALHQSLLSSATSTTTTATIAGSAHLDAFSSPARRSRRVAPRRSEHDGAESGAHQRTAITTTAAATANRGLDASSTSTLATTSVGSGGAKMQLQLWAAATAAIHHWQVEQQVSERFVLPVRRRAAVAESRPVVCTTTEEEQQEGEEWCAAKGEQSIAFVKHADEEAEEDTLGPVINAGAVKQELKKDCSTQLSMPQATEAKLPGSVTVPIKPEIAMDDMEGDRGAATDASSFCPQQTSSPPQRVRATPGQLRSAWRGVVRDWTSTLHHQRSVAQRTVLSLRSNASTTSASSQERVLWTALRYRQERQAQLTRLQAQLADEVYRHAYITAHQQRLKLLFGDAQTTSETADGEGRGFSSSYAHLQSEEKSEAAYLRSLNPSRSSKEANILHVISAIDEKLSEQLHSVYLSAPSVASTAAAAATTAAHTEEGKHLPTTPSQDTTNTTNNMAKPSARQQLQSAVATQRLAALDVCLAESTRLVPPFARMLMGYQQEGVRWLLQLNLIERMNGILADDMGLGKTAQTVVYLACYKTLIEEAVERPLHRLIQFVREQQQHGWPSLRLSHEQQTGSPQPPLPFSVPEDIARTLAMLSPRLGGLDEPTEGGARTPLSLSPEASASSLSSPFASFTASRYRVLAQCAAAVRLLKEVKRWVWQSKLTVVDDEEEDAEMVGAEEGGFERTTAGGTKEKEEREGDAEGEEETEPESDTVTDRASTKAASRSGLQNGVAGQQLPAAAPVKRKRGRPPKHPVETPTTLTLASTAERGFTTTAAVADETPRLHGGAASPRYSLKVPQHSTVLDAALERVHSMRPVLIVAPLSTLPHWKAEFSHFGVAECFDVFVLNGPRPDRDAQARAFLALIKAREQREETEAKGRRWSQLATHRKPTRDAVVSAVAEAAAAAAGPPRKRRRRTATGDDDVEEDAKERAGRGEKNGHRQREDREEESGAAMTWASPARTPVLIIPHDLLVRPLYGVQRHIPHVEWHVVIMDEAQRIKNYQGGLFAKMCRLSSVSRLVLTGTPLQNNMTELFALLQFLAPQSFHAREQRDLLEQLDNALLEASRSNALEDRELHILLCRRVHRLLAPFILRRDKSVIKALLPPKKEFAVVCPLLPFQQTKIREVEEKYRRGCLGGNLTIQIRKMLLHPYTTLPYFYIDEDVVRTSGKLLVLDFMMQFLHRTHHKFLVFCSWTLVLDVVETLCGMRGMPYVRLDGRTSVEQREANIRVFNHVAEDGLLAGQPSHGTASSYSSVPSDAEKRALAGDTVGGRSTSNKGNNGAVPSSSGSTAPAAVVPPQRPCCFLISKVAGGVGLNLQSADTVFLLDVDYNPQRDNQALSRVYRVGQKREVRVFRLLIDHEIERGIVAIHRAKEHLDQAVVQAGKYDLHSSAQEREKELMKVFDVTASPDGSASALDDLTRERAAAEVVLPSPQRMPSQTGTPKGGSDEGKVGHPVTRAAAAATSSSSCSVTSTEGVVPTCPQLSSAARLSPPAVDVVSSPTSAAAVSEDLPGSPVFPFGPPDEAEEAVEGSQMSTGAAAAVSAEASGPTEDLNDPEDKDDDYCAQDEDAEGFAAHSQEKENGVGDEEDEEDTVAVAQGTEENVLNASPSCEASGARPFPPTRSPTDFAAHLYTVSRTARSPPPPQHSHDQHVWAAGEEDAANVEEQSGMGEENAVSYAAPSAVDSSHFTEQTDTSVNLLTSETAMCTAASTGEGTFASAFTGGPPAGYSTAKAATPPSPSLPPPASAKRKRFRRVTFAVEDDPAPSSPSTVDSFTSPTRSTGDGAGVGCAPCTTSSPPTTTAHPPPPPPPATYILAMEDRLREVLIRNESERAVLDDMFAEQRIALEVERGEQLRKSRRGR